MVSCFFQTRTAGGPSAKSTRQIRLAKQSATSSTPGFRRQQPFRPRASLGKRQKSSGRIGRPGVQPLRSIR